MSFESKAKKLKKLSSNENSTWIEKASWRAANTDWLEDSFKVALIVLRSLRDKKWTQKELADKMEVTPQQVNKIIKGKENLSLETLNKLKRALNLPSLFTIGDTVRTSDTYLIQISNGTSSLLLAIKGHKEEESYFENMSTSNKIGLPIFVKANGASQISKREVCDLGN
jgi:transcriptional regulator with XRE-family HTH domain